jgi:hypothetical protein
VIFGDPKEPGHSCPDIDQIISMLEDLREENKKLREWGQWWKDKAEELDND